MNNSESYCGICYQSEYLITLECNHLLCYLCAKYIKKCPLCRKEINLKLNHLTINDFADQTIYTEQKTKTQLNVKWLYSSRDNKSLWYYDNITNNDIENYYNIWIKQYKILEETKIIYDNDTNIIKLFLKQLNKKEYISEYSDETNSEESEEEYTILENYYFPIIQIGSSRYLINFYKMYQLEIKNLNKRNITRKIFSNLKEKDEFDNKNVRGKFGIYLK